MIDEVEFNRTLEHFNDTFQNIGKYEDFKYPFAITEEQLELMLYRKPFGSEFRNMLLYVVQQVKELGYLARRVEVDKEQKNGYRSMTMICEDIRIKVRDNEET